MQQLVLKAEPANTSVASTTKKHYQTIGVANISPPDFHTSILSLPPEVLASIFQLVDVQGKGRVAQVCRSWRDTAELREVWREDTVQINAYTVHEHAYSYLARRGVHKIELRDLGKWSPITMPPAMLRTLSNLTHLVLSHCSLCDNTVEQIAKSFKKLVLLKLGVESVNEMTDASIGHICSGLKKLVHLSLYLFNGGRITDAGIQQLATVGPPLKFLALHGCTALTNKSLRHLSLGNPNLEALELVFNPNVTATGIRYVATMKQLHYLNFTSKDYVIDHQLMQINWMTSLRKLILSSSPSNLFDDSEMEILANSSSMIEELVLIGCVKITDVSLQYVATMPNLRQLAMNRCPLVSQVGLGHLMRGNQKLTGLDIRHCPGMGPGTLGCIVAGLPKLKQLRLDERHVSKNCLELAMRQLRHLVYLDLTYWIRSSNLQEFSMTSTVKVPLVMTAGECCRLIAIATRGVVILV